MSRLVTEPDLPYLREHPEAAFLRYAADRASSGTLHPPEGTPVLVRQRDRLRAGAPHHRGVPRHGRRAHAIAAPRCCCTSCRG